MSWQDRDYASDYRPMGRPTTMYRRAFGPTHSVVTTLIVVNVVIYLLCRSNPKLFMFGAMISDSVMHGEIWRLVTSDYLHWNTTHIFMNMLGLYFLGRPLEQLWGPKKFFAVYTISGILGSLFYMILTLMGVLQPGIAAGASGCVLGLLGAAAVLFPHAEVYIYFLFPVKIRVLAVVLAGLYVLNVLRGGNNAGGDACHIAGLAFGVWWAMKGDLWWSSGRRRARVVVGPPRGFAAHIQQRRNDAELIDRILQKVHNVGVASLTEREKRALAEATQRQRRDEQRFDRPDIL